MSNLTTFSFSSFFCSTSQHDEDEENHGKKGKKDKKKKKHSEEGSDLDSGDEDAETPEEYLTAAKKLVEEQKERNKHEFSEEGELARQQHEGVELFSLLFFLFFVDGEFE